MLTNLKQISKRPFVRNVITIATGTAAAQAVTMAFTPLVTRLYGAEVFGTQGVFMSLAGALTMIAALTYPMAIILPKGDGSARSLTKLSVYVGIVLSLISALLFLLFGPALLRAINSESIEKYILLLPLFMLFSVFSDVLSQWLIRKQAFKICAQSSLYQAIGLNSIKIGAAFITPSAASLIIANTVGKLLQAGLLLLGFQQYKRKNKTKEEKRVDTLADPSIFETAKTYQDFPLLRAPQVFINTISQILPIMMLASFFGPIAVGYYALANSVLGLPSGLIGASVMQVFYPRANEAHQKGESLEKLIIKTTLGMALAGFIPFLIIILFGPYLFELIFGQGWGAAGTYAQWLSAWLFFAYISRPTIAAIPVLGIQKGFLVYEIFSTAAKFIAIYVGYYIFNSDTYSIALFSISGTISYAYLIVATCISARSKKAPKPKI